MVLIHSPLIPDFGRPLRTRSRGKSRGPKNGRQVHYPAAVER